MPTLFTESINAVADEFSRLSINTRRQRLLPDWCQPKQPRFPYSERVEHCVLRKNAAGTVDTQPQFNSFQITLCCTSLRPQTTYNCILPFPNQTEVLHSIRDIFNSVQNCDAFIWVVFKHHVADICVSYSSKHTGQVRYDANSVWIMCEDNSYITLATVTQL
jgi:hypothetical protein